jgi:hypothetical protein
MAMVVLLSQNGELKKITVLKMVQHVAITTTRKTWRHDDHKAHRLTGATYNAAKAHPNGTANCAATMPAISASVAGMSKWLVLSVPAAETIFHCNMKRRRAIYGLHVKELWLEAPFICGKKTMVRAISPK